MSGALRIHRAGPGLTLQDGGRPGYLALGLSRGGAADPLALAEGAALLGQDAGLAAIEMAGMGGEFEATAPLRIALTGAPMVATLDGTRLAWNASHSLQPGQRLGIGAAREGIYGYLHVGGGFEAEERLGARSAHLAAGIGAPLDAGESLTTGKDTGTATGLCLPQEARFSGGTLRIVASVHTGRFPESLRARFEDTVFQRDPRSNRMAARLASEGEGFGIDIGRAILSEAIVPGDIQITGDGTPFVLMAECQTTGGYPRIGTVLPCDLPRVAQAGPGARLAFRFVTLEEAVAAETRAAEARATLGRRVEPLIRDPASIPDLLSYQLVSGVTAGRELEPEGG
ncbi:MAG: biotin-dependent carboxyltransferase family protein [Roseovarius sp.]